jgi:hypothetical protein
VTEGRRSEDYVALGSFREVWTYKFVPKTNLVDVHMGRLGRKIDGPHEPPMILNVRGKGFILRSEDGQSASEQAR